MRWRNEYMVGSGARGIRAVWLPQTTYTLPFLSFFSACVWHYINSWSTVSYRQRQVGFGLVFIHRKEHRTGSSDWLLEHIFRTVLLLELYHDDVVNTCTREWVSVAAGVELNAECRSVCVAHPIGLAVIDGLAGWILVETVQCTFGFGHLTYWSPSVCVGVQCFTHEANCATHNPKQELNNRYLTTFNWHVHAYKVRIYEMMHLYESLLWTALWRTGYTLDPYIQGQNYLTKMHSHMSQYFPMIQTLIPLRPPP